MKDEDQQHEDEVYMITTNVEINTISGNINMNFPFVYKARIHLTLLGFYETDSEGLSWLRPQDGATAKLVKLSKKLKK